MELLELAVLGAPVRHSMLRLLLLLWLMLSLTPALPPSPMAPGNTPSAGLQSSAVSEPSLFGSAGSVPSSG